MRLLVPFFKKKYYKNLQLLFVNSFSREWINFLGKLASLLTYLLTYVLTYILTYLLTYLLTPYSTVLLQKLTGLQLVKKFPTFYETRRFITAFTIAGHLSLFQVSSIQSILHPNSECPS
jgi:NhaP-type Na+/H+ or K+/H+ antiporter